MHFKLIFTVRICNCYSPCFHWVQSCIIVEAYIGRFDYRKLPSGCLCKLEKAKEQLTHMKFEHLEFSFLDAVIRFCLCWTSGIAVSFLRRVIQFKMPGVWLSFNALIATSSSWPGSTPSYTA